MTFCKRLARAKKKHSSQLGTDYASPFNAQSQGYVRYQSTMDISDIKTRYRCRDWPHWPFPFPVAHLHLSTSMNTLN